MQPWLACGFEQLDNKQINLNYNFKALFLLSLLEKYKLKTI